MIAAGLSIAATNGYCNGLKGVGSTAAETKPIGTLKWVQAQKRCSQPLIPVRSTTKIAGFPLSRAETKPRGAFKLK
jgi:hypothetical protein